jgi:Na+-transporting NADH:ubiquinone oxidoreductase subunit B
MDLKRMMILVVIACLPCVFMAMYNTGLQANLALDPAKVALLQGWRHDVIACSASGYSPPAWWPMSSTARCTSCRCTS